MMQRNVADETPQKKMTRVNGIGMFNSWRRNFKSPFFAMLDIVDNAIDAALEEKNGNNFNGRIDIHEAYVKNPNKDGAKKRRAELVIVNNSVEEIVHLSTILEVYKSSKVDKEDIIGQNGVGKCICAA